MLSSLRCLSDFCVTFCSSPSPLVSLCPADDAPTSPSLIPPAMDDSISTPAPQQKRPRVAEENRKRAVRAYASPTLHTMRRVQQANGRADVMAVAE